MTPRWRAMLRLRALLQGLLEQHVPMGVLMHLVGRLATYSDSGLVDGFARSVNGMAAQLAVELAHSVIDEEPFEAPPGEPRDLLRIGDELRRRHAEARRDYEARGDQADNALQGAYEELLEFVLPLMGAPLPDLERFGAFLESERFYAAMQAYRHASLVPQGEVAAAYEAVKAALREAVRR